MKPRFAKIGLPFAAMLGWTALAAPAEAQSDGIVFVDLGRWTIYEITGAGYCEMRLNAGSTGSLVMSKRAGSPGSLRLTLNNPGRGFGNDVVWAFDQEQYGGSVLGRGTFAPSSDSSAIEAAFRRAETLSILQGGATVATISLKSSAAGYRLLNQCAEQWRTSFIPPREYRVASAQPQPTTPRATTSLPATPRSSTSSRSQVAASGPYPPNRAVTPLNASSWIRNEDFRRLPELSGDGTITFSLLVNDRGRVEECSVLKSSGSRELDAKTCRALQRRARFDPATDARGNAIEATYSSKVEFAVAR